MRVFVVVLLFFGYQFSWSQSYIDSGIRHYNADEFKEALIDFEEAEKVKSMFTAKAIGKLQIYRAKTIWELNKSNEKITDETIDQLLLDLSNAVSVDSIYVEDANTITNGLYSLVQAQVEDLYKKASKEKDVWTRIGILDDYISRLFKIQEIKNTEEVELAIAKAHHEIGDIYFAEEDIMFLSKAGEYYQSAIEHYEIARYNDPYSKDIIKALLDLSKKMDDPARVEEYSKLLELAGG